ncbi:MAG: hypothetical protein MJ208_00755 [Bacilli bacterium]|nr:hypothetical protein [Bacilli bacterium]
MNRMKLIPLTALLAVPLFMGCDSKTTSNVLFNPNCTVYQFGTSLCEVKISDDTPDAKFKKDIKTSDIEISNDGKLDGKTLQSVTYKDEKTVELAFTGTSKKNYGTAGDKTSVRFNESAFSNKTSGGDLTVSLFTNFYDIVSSGPEPVDITKVKVISMGADFKDNILSPEEINFKNGHAADHHEFTAPNWFNGTLKIEKGEKDPIFNANCYTLTLTSELANADTLPIIRIRSNATIIEDGRVYCNFDFNFSKDENVVFYTAQ